MAAPGGHITSSELLACLERSSSRSPCALPRSDLGDSPSSGGKEGKARLGLELNRRPSSRV